MLIKKPPIKIEKKEAEIDINSLHGEVNRYGVKLVPGANGFEQWVIDAKTGKPVKRDDYECMESNGLYLWVKKGQELKIINGLPYPSIWPN